MFYIPLGVLNTKENIPQRPVLPWMGFYHFLPFFFIAQ